MFDWLGDALGAILSGGVTGIAGAALNTWGELAKAKQAAAHEQAMADLNQKGLRLEAELNLRRIETEGEVAMNLQAAKTLAASYEHDRATYSTEAVGGLSGAWGSVGRFLLVLVDVARGFVRPALTLYLAAVVTWLLLEVFHLAGGIEGALDAAAVVDLLQQVVLVILYITATVIFWWFGGRQKGPGEMLRPAR